MIYHYKLILQYKGTNYLGWQVQPLEYGKTIQSELNEALKIVAKSSEVKSIGSGRTDAGVHALGQVVKISIPLRIDPKKLVPALNVKLPNDIRVIDAEDSTEAFIPTIHARSKEYHYRFTTRKFVASHQNELIANYPFDLDLEKMRKACLILRGLHDFTNYYTEGTEVKSTIREIFSCELEIIQTTDWDILPQHYVLKIVGSGFLKQMVRMLIGALWNVGRGKVSLQEFEDSLTAKRISRLGPVAPPEGLYLVRVNY